MLHFNLGKPVSLIWFGEFTSPEEGWTHLTRTLLDYELIVVTDGELAIADERKEYTVHTGEYLILSPTRNQHGTRPCRCKFFWMHFQAETASPMLNMPAHGKYVNLANIVHLASLLFDAEKTAHRGVRSNYLATGLLLELSHQQKLSGEIVEAPRSPRRILCDRIIEYVQWNSFADLNVATIAHELGYHEKYLSMVFHETEGVTLKDYLTMRRLEEAKRLLHDDALSINEVAYYLNFQSPHNFSRFFKKESGMTPKEYREFEKSNT